ncbi:cancer-related nucleoside-triphosphatase homolog [Ornithodoros turicata]
MSLTKNIILTGPPGVGKTTLVKKVCESLVQNGASIHGFYTEEVRKDGRRIGFDVVSTDGKRAPLARLCGLVKDVRGPSVGQYTVCLQSFEEVSLPSLQPPCNCDLIVLDEVGKMELFSHSFDDLVRQLFDNSSTPILVTVPITRGKPIPLVEKIKSCQNSVLFVVSRDNRDRLESEILVALGAKK